MASLGMVGAAGELPSPTPPTVAVGRKLTTIDLVGGIYCHICTLVFGNKKKFDSHYLSHNTCTEEITYTCVACRAASTTYTNFRGHCYNSHVIKNRYRCDNCNKNFSKLFTLKEHIDSCHNFICKQPNCDKRFASRQELHVHQILHKEEVKPPYQCQHCTEQIENIQACEEHIDRHCVFTYSCPVCNEDINKDNASQHLTKHFGFEVLNKDIDDEEIPEDSSVNVVGGVTCCFCKKLFQNRIEIDQHFAEDHPNEVIVYTCIICDKKYERYYQFGNHCYFHFAQNRYTCETCHKTFPRLSKLVAHADVHKPDSKHFIVDNEMEQKCQLCGLRLNSLLTARRHLSVHRRAQFHCPVCTRRYGEKYLLMKHVPQHFEAVLHMCKVCHKVFSAKNRLIQHAKTHVPAAKSYQCNFCSKGFFKPYQLSQHLNVHTGNRPYTCADCPKTFASRPNWHKHVQRMHNVDKQAKSKPTKHTDLDVTTESISDDLLEPEVAKVQEEKGFHVDSVMGEPVIDAVVVAREAQRYESEVRGAGAGRGPSLAELTPIMPEDIDNIFAEMLNSPPALIPREYGPDLFPEEGPLPHVPPQLVGPPPPPSPPWEPPILTKLCGGLLDQLSDGQLALSIIDTDIIY